MIFIICSGHDPQENAASNSFRNKAGRQLRRSRLLLYYLCIYTYIYMVLHLPQSEKHFYVTNPHLKPHYLSSKGIKVSLDEDANTGTQSSSSTKTAKIKLQWPQYIHSSINNTLHISSALCISFLSGILLQHSTYTFPSTFTTLPKMDKT